MWPSYYDLMRNNASEKVRIAVLQSTEAAGKGSCFVRILFSVYGQLLTEFHFMISYRNPFVNQSQRQVRRIRMRRLLIASVLFLIVLASCSNGKQSLEDEIVGKWIDSSGFTIEFYEGGTGFIEGVPGKIPDSSFSYITLNETTVQINFQGVTYDIDILIDGDQLTWKDELGEVVYTRAE